MPHHLLRFSRELDRRLDALAQTTGLSKAELIERCLEGGVAALEAELMVEGAEAARAGTSIDQLLRESGLGA
ncbi:ribbon-helix-helix protein, CopG family [Halomonas sp. KAO]|uniref:ribbon-helix-helix protein, CopG family n=1 Tax=unclassified Halomonas TaxID=2609666 RepID=UPI00189F84A9|nr:MULTISPECIES: ribbon-helix-helix protein, CopG family [unclassified Halomonas]MBF7051784.1 ribbon-helix-helix protein, CopG family [Halomonas sp. KAO]MDT0500429.1 ribbon-helix-helix protein, CopG family [Halomonas sp. PAR7]MDT0511674.1 ribbon-helix-helix protein, CopG family [Halomonas sp. LES1]MDT0590038.1 ribbon-helix-helix protein, CopG family [Halomonas sp. PAR8]